jgi:hypothetical protein
MINRALRDINPNLMRPESLPASAPVDIKDSLIGGHRHLNAECAEKKNLPQWLSVEHGENSGGPIADDEALHRITKERDVLAEEVRKLTRQLGQAQPREPTSSWQAMTASSREIRRLEDLLKETKETLEVEITASKRLRAANSELLSKVTELEGVWTELSTNRALVATLLATIEQGKSSFNQLSEDYKDLKRKYAEMELDMNNRLRILEDENTSLRESIEASRQASLETRAAPESNGLQVQDHSVQELKAKLLKSENTRRKLLNQLHDLRGNIRVFVRCRPLLHHEKVADSPIVCCEDSSMICVSTQPSHSMSAYSRAPSSSAHAAQTYNFDQVFKSSSSQEQIFDSISDLVQSALDGYRVCIFCYGQTGSGKTFTMAGGGADRLRDGGIIPRAVEKMIEDVMAMQAGGWSITLTASMLEVYNEAVRDVLAAHGVGGSSSSSCEGDREAAEQSAANHRIVFSNGRVSVSDVSSYPIETSSLAAGLKSFADLMSTADKRRTVAATAMNERSSRSHLLFYLDVVGTHPGLGTVLEGGLRLVDLAGSERLDRCGTVGDASRFKETVSINRSLSSLGEVFLALGSKSAHVPYRNSKLTMLLQVRREKGKSVCDSDNLLYIIVFNNGYYMRRTACLVRERRSWLSTSLRARAPFRRPYARCDSQARLGNYGCYAAHGACRDITHQSHSSLLSSQVNQIELGQAKKHMYKAPPELLLGLARPHTTDGAAAARKTVPESAPRPESKAALAAMNSSKAMAERMNKLTSVKQATSSAESTAQESVAEELKGGGNLSNDEDFDKKREMPPLPLFRSKGQQLSSSRMSIAGVKRPLIRDEGITKERVNQESSVHSFIGSNYSNHAIPASNISSTGFSLNTAAPEVKRVKKSAGVGAWR